MDQPAMRIGLVDGARGGDVPFPGDSLHAGTDPACEVRLRAGAAAHHLTLERSRAGVVLYVQPGAAHVYVNARPVRECALLRVGDVVSVGIDTLLLKQASDEVGEAVALPDLRPVAAGSASLVGLRAMAGPLCGRRIAIDGGENLDALSLSGVGGCLRLRPLGGRVAFDYLPGDEGAAPPGFNGVEASRGSLAHGDQITWGKHRLVLEMPAPGPAGLSPPRPVERMDEAPERSAGPQTEVWWLIATAALLALAIAVLLLVRS